MRLLIAIRGAVQASIKGISDSADDLEVCQRKGEGAAKLRQLGKGDDSPAQQARATVDFLNPAPQPKVLAHVHARK